MKNKKNVSLEKEILERAKRRVERKNINPEYVEDLRMFTDQRLRSLRRFESSVAVSSELAVPETSKTDPVLGRFIQKILNKSYYVVKNIVEGAFVKQETFNREVFSQIKQINKRLGALDEKSDDFVLDYSKFEDRFRGTRDLIKKRQSRYLKRIKLNDFVLDIGCGRGEFLELLRENNVKNVSGVDIYEPFVGYCNQLGLDVVHEDAVSYLRKQQDERYNVITAFHVVEHLSNEYLMNFLDLCHKKLKKGGLLILESPNPKSLYIFSAAFYIDIDHVKPIHPEALRFLTEEKGFLEVEIEEMHKPEKALELLKGKENDKKLINKNLELLNNIIFGPQDYAIIAKK